MTNIAKWKCFILWKLDKPKLILSFRQIMFTLMINHLQIVEIEVICKVEDFGCWFHLKTHSTVEKSLVARCLFASESGCLSSSMLDDSRQHFNNIPINWSVLKFQFIRVQKYLWLHCRGDESTGGQLAGFHSSAAKRVGRRHSDGH